MSVRPETGRGMVDDLSGQIVPVDLTSTLDRMEAEAAAKTWRRLACGFKIYEPFSRPGPDGRINLVIYVHRSDGSKRRVGSMDLIPPDAEAFLQFWREAGGGVATREELGLPPRVRDIRAGQITINPA